MRLNKKCYIARKYYVHGYGAQSIYEEALFESYESAYKYIKEISEEDDERFLSEIVSLVINDSTPWENEQNWTFDRKAELIRCYDALKREENCRVEYHNGYKTVYPEPDPESFTGKFKVGEIVMVKAFPWHPESRMPEETIGVITNTPVTYDEWIRHGNDKYEWDNTYVIDYIRSGYLDHIHITEKNLKILTGEIPENLLFIRQLSEHYKGGLTIKKDILEDIFLGKVFVEKVRHFNENESIQT